jgi:hypothetical protein
VCSGGRAHPSWVTGSKAITPDPVLSRSGATERGQPLQLSVAAGVCAVHGKASGQCRLPPTPAHMRGCDKLQEEYSGRRLDAHPTAVLAERPLEDCHAEIRRPDPSRCRRRF